SRARLAPCLLPRGGWNVLLGGRHGSGHPAFDPHRARLPAPRHRPRGLGALARLDRRAEAGAPLPAAFRRRGGAGRARRGDTRAAAHLGRAGARRNERGGVRPNSRAGAGNGDRSRDRRGLHPGGTALAVLRRPRALLRQEGGSGDRTSRYGLTRMRRSVLGVLVAVLGVVAPAAADAAVHTQLVGNFDTPIQVFAPNSVPGSTLYVVEKGGKVIRRQSGGHRNVVLDIHGHVSTGSAGRKLFVYYTNKDWDSRVVRYALNSGLGHVQPGSRKTILRAHQPA